ncbi:hypothetical protein BDK89_0336 [Ilumatobacter fluminis]|uniref:Uncharacterized protein n=1 Tax=Ilumatobacter fluminis TaxID=467091 RepID=A0A4R7HV81_9ACTN|nr:hypothetical protein [Ilumatobacter fluminis]TDT14780.1 hypothetical protein BDK89_0336 [Ilumatobacter fluminis]
MTSPNTYRPHPDCRCHPLMITTDDIDRAVPSPVGGRLPERGPLADPCAVANAAAAARSISDIFRTLGITRDQRSTRRLRAVSATYGIALPHRAGKPKRPSPLDDRDKLVNAVIHASNTRDAVQHLGLSSCGTTNRRFEQRCHDEEIELPWKQNTGTARQLNAASAHRVETALPATTSDARVPEELGIGKGGNAYTWIRRRCHPA